MKLQLFTLLAMAIVHQIAFAADALVFECKRAERDFIEEYEMKLVPANKSAKAKIYLDGRDLDQSDASGKQTVKSMQITPSNIVMMVDTQFDPETIGGVSYPAGTVSSLLTLNQVTGKLKKVETIQGGILGSHLGNGTRMSEETCVPVKAK